MLDQQALPNTPKIPLARYLKTATDRTPVGAAHVTAPDGVAVVQHAGGPAAVTAVADWPRQTALDAWLLADPQQVTTVEIPADFAEDTPVLLTGPLDGGGVVRVRVGERAHVVLQETWRSAGEHLGIGVRLELATGATVSWLTYDAIPARTAVVQRTADLAADATLNWTVAGFSQNSGANLATVNLTGVGARATVNVGVLASGKQEVGYTTAITNVGRKTAGHINQRGVITDAAHLVFNGIGHIDKGARGSDNQQENRVLMLDNQARGDANPILLIDENDVTAGHAASVSRVDERQLYYLMSRGLPAGLAKRLVIRGFLEAGLAEITDPAVKAELFATIDERLVTIDAR